MYTACDNYSFKKTVSKMELQKLKGLVPRNELKTFMFLILDLFDSAPTDAPAAPAAPKPDAAPSIDLFGTGKE